MKRNIQIISAPSILGLKPSGVEWLSDSLLNEGIAKGVKSVNPVINIPTLNYCYDPVRDTKTKCLNSSHLHTFSLVLSEQVSRQLKKGSFQLVLGGDCSILLGIMPALKKEGEFGLLFLDAHADFYQPSQSTTGEVADMDLAIVTGHGPGKLTNIDGLKPYVKTKNIIHIGQRDADEAKKYGSQDIKNTFINCFDLDNIRTKGLTNITKEVLGLLQATTLKGFWLHFDTDVLHDDENPAVDYRLPGGLTFQETEYLLCKLLETHKVIGMSVTIFNPTMDVTGKIARRITVCIAKALNAISR